MAEGIIQGCIAIAGFLAGNALCGQPGAEACGPLIRVQAKAFKTIKARVQRYQLVSEQILSCGSVLRLDGQDRGSFVGRTPAQVVRSGI